MSEYTSEFLQKVIEESKRLESYATQADESQMKSIADFQRAYEVRRIHLLSTDMYYVVVSDLLR